jgi:hypothetical protein
LSLYRKREPSTIIDISRISGTNFSDGVRRGWDNTYVNTIFVALSVVLWEFILQKYYNSSHFLLALACLWWENTLYGSNKMLHCI